MLYNLVVKNHYMSRLFEKVSTSQPSPDGLGYLVPADL